MAKKKVTNAIPSNEHVRILSYLWENGPSTVREVHDYTNERKKKPVVYTTTLKQMILMEKAGLVRRDESQRSHVYTAIVQKAVTERRLVRRFVATVFSGNWLKLIERAYEEASLDEKIKIRQALQ